MEHTIEQIEEMWQDNQKLKDENRKLRQELKEVQRTGGHQECMGLIELRLELVKLRSRVDACQKIKECYKEIVP